MQIKPVRPWPFAHNCTKVLPDFNERIAFLNSSEAGVPASEIGKLR